MTATLHVQSRSEPLVFKFRIRDPKGNLQGFLASKGVIDEQGATIGKRAPIGIPQLRGADARGEWLVIQFVNERGQAEVLPELTDERGEW